MFQYLTFKHASDNKHPAQFATESDFLVRLRKWEGRPIPASAFHQSWRIPTVWKDRLAWQDRALLSDQETALLLWGVFPPSGRAVGWERGEPWHFRGASIVLAEEPYLNRYAGCHWNTNK